MQGEQARIADKVVLHDIAKDIALIVKKGMSIHMYGELGSGKTTLSAMIINHLYDIHNDVVLHNKIAVTSPTFNIVNCYNISSDIAVWHFDLYRVKRVEELEHLSIVDAARDISIVEWPEIASGCWSADHIINVRLRSVDSAHIEIVYGVGG